VRTLHRIRGCRRRGRTAELQRWLSTNGRRRDRGSRGRTPGQRHVVAHRGGILGEHRAQDLRIDGRSLGYRCTQLGARAAVLVSNGGDRRGCPYRRRHILPIGASVMRTLSRLRTALLAETLAVAWEELLGQPDTLVDPVPHRVQVPRSQHGPVRLGRCT
jgi:hypothetical protein